MLNTRAERVICRARLYKPIRTAYQRTLNRDFYRWRLDAQRFYSQFVSRDSLVLDVGANTGYISEVFLDLGARVVAVEPNPSLAERTARRFPRLTVEPVAVGDAPGVAELHLGADTGHSTLSPDWAEDHDERWLGTVSVPVVTIDSLIERYGVPDFVKIDVEGYEHHALRGLTHRVPALCFEFLCDELATAEACIEHLRGREFAIAGPEGLEIGPWADADGAIRALRDHAARFPGSYGDVYAR